MSDSGDFRGSREEKKKDETVMISSEQLSDLVASAKADPGPETAAPAATPGPPEAPASSGAPARSGNTMVFVVIGVVVVAVVLALVLVLG